MKKGAPESKMAKKNHEDLRVQKTKRLLFSTFMNMLAEGSYEDITVNSLCQAADIRRATFYKHFSDKTDFSLFVMYSLREQFEKGIWKSGIQFDAGTRYYVAYANAVIEFIDNNEAIVKNLLQSAMLSPLLKMVIEQNAKETFERLKMSEKLGLSAVCSVETVTTVLSCGITAIIFDWISAGKSKPKSEISYEIEAVINALLT